MPVLIQIAIGGALGALARYVSVITMQRIAGSAFPYGTMFVNIIGSFLMGLCAVWLLEKADGKMVPFIMTGVFGGFTTFSAFSLDTIRLLEEGRLAIAGVYVGGSVLLSITALFLGILFARGLA